MILLELLFSVEKARAWVNKQILLIVINVIKEIDTMMWINGEEDQAYCR
jgi:hypothetical protein